MSRTLPHRVLEVTERGAGRRVDVFLTLRFSDWSRSQFARFIREGLVLSDSRTLKPSTTLHVGEVLRIYARGLAPTEAPPPMPPVLYEDEHLLAVNKPAGLLMHSVGQKWAYGLIGLARGARPDAAIDLAHRLDRETSGVVLLTKTVESNRLMKELFSERKVGKVYWALVRGTPSWDELTCEAPLGAAGREVELRQAARPDGAPAKTRFKVLRRLDGLALVGCKPFTGRTHQIRAHLEEVGFPILGDKLYGQPDHVFLEHIRQGVTDAVRAAIGFPRHALHARVLTFPHPFTGRALRLTAPVPEDLAAILAGARPTWDAEPA